MFGRKKLAKAMKGKKVHDAVQKKAAAVQAYWKGISPVFGDRPPHRDAPARGQAGSYRDSIIVVDTSDDSGARARVKATDWKAKMIEFGKPPHMPTYAPLAKTKAKFR